MTTKRRLRTCFTTGSAASAKGALSLILIGEKPHSVQIKLLIEPLAETHETTPHALYIAHRRELWHTM